MPSVGLKNGLLNKILLIATEFRKAESKAIYHNQETGEFSLKTAEVSKWPTLFRFHHLPHFPTHPVS